ncbi:MAG TPA: class I SAM-dependent methyltransferase [Vicinamibacterales bacterium]|nr:class I SAM-dependent methyltransferase [Vicinamibacterales bacterium]
MPAHDDWAALAREAEADELRERILTGYQGGKPFTPYVPTVDLPCPLNRVLDFGCGVGRNFPLLKRLARHVTGYDLPPMIERCRSLGPPVDDLRSDWDGLTRQTFDLVFATLVLQHIHPADLGRYLADFARISAAVYLLTRTTSDFGTCVLDDLAAAGLFAAGPCVEVEHDAATHQLRVIGRTSLEAARARRDPAHFEVVLTPCTALPGASR